MAAGFPLHLAIPRRKGGKATSRKDGSQGKQSVSASRSPRLCPGINFIPLLRATRNRESSCLFLNTSRETSAGPARPRSLKRTVSSASPAKTGDNGVVQTQRGSLYLPATQARGFPRVPWPDLKKAVTALRSIIGLPVSPTICGHLVPGSRFGI